MLSCYITPLWHFSTADAGSLPAETATFTPAEATNSSSSLIPTDSVGTSSAQLSLASALSSLGKPSTDISLGRGIPPLSKKLVEKIFSWEYVDFTELPPARGLSKPHHTPGPNILLVQTAESIQGQKKIMPDLHTWMQCFSIYVSVLAIKFPQHVPELLAYSREIMRASRQLKWPSWVIYDTSYRRHMAEIGQRDWSKVDPSIYARCFTGWARSSSWCMLCVTLDHDTADCPFALFQDRRSRRSVPYPPSSSAGRVLPKSRSTPICIKYNKYNGDCRHGESCKFRHECSQCQGPHPRSQCKGDASSVNKADN